MNILRKYKISKITDTPLDSSELEVFNFVQTWLSDLVIFKHDNYPDSIFYMNSKGLFVFEHETELNYIFVRFQHFWEILENQFNISYENIKSFLKYMIEERLKQKVNINYISDTEFMHPIQESFKVKPAISYPKQTIQEAFGIVYDDNTYIEEEFKK